MATIKVLVDTFKNEIYKVVTDFYNENKPKTWTKLIPGNFSEGGFEMPLEDDLMQQQKKKGCRDANQLCRQVRWSNGKLITPSKYIPFAKEHTQLLFLALKHGFGADKVIMV